MTDTSFGYQLELGPLALMGGGDPSSFTFDVSADGTDFGNPIAVREVIDSLLRDGDYATTTRYSNRTITLAVRISAATPGLMADAEATLMAQLDRINTLTWRRPSAPATLFEVVRSESAFISDGFDLDEVLRHQWTFDVTLECEPHPHSEATTVLSWTGPGVQLAPTNSTTGWTSVSGGAIAALSGGAIQSTTNAPRTVKRTIMAGSYLRLVTRTQTGGGTAVSSLTINGATISTATMKRYGVLAEGDLEGLLIPTHAYRGATVDVQFVLTPAFGTSRGEVWAMHALEYPTPSLGTDGKTTVVPQGIGVINPRGSARAPLMIQFTVPTGGAFVYTGPDPDAAIRQRGAGQTTYAKFTIAASPDPGDEITVGSQTSFWPNGTWYEYVGTTNPQPVALNPNGVWPTPVANVYADSAQWDYPADTAASVTFFPTAGVVTIISPDINLPGGYQPGAVTHADHSMHPVRSGFQVADKDGKSITATLTWQEHWVHHAAA